MEVDVNCFWSFRLFQVCFGLSCCCFGLCLAVLVVLCCLWRQKGNSVVSGCLNLFVLFEFVCLKSSQLFKLFEDMLRLFYVLCCLLGWFKLVFFEPFSVV